MKPTPKSLDQITELHTGLSPSIQNKYNNNEIKGLSF